MPGPARRQSLSPEGWDGGWAGEPSRSQASLGEPRAGGPSAQEADGELETGPRVVDHGAA